MSVEEYWNTRQLERLPPGSVDVEKKDIKHYWPVGQSAPKHLRDHSGLLVELQTIPGHTYFVPEDSNGILYVMDDHGNRKSPSVFKLKEPINEFLK